MSDSPAPNSPPVPSTSPTPPAPTRDPAGPCPLPTEPTDTCPPPTDATAPKQYFCILCGCEMLNIHCKLICPRCGYREDCSDLFADG